MNCHSYFKLTMIGPSIPLIINWTYYDRFSRCHRKNAFSITPKTMTPEYLS